MSPGGSGESERETLLDSPGPEAGGPGPTRQVGRYLIERELARGGMGVVYRATDPALRRAVALKLLRGQKDPRYLERFRIEALASARLRHPSIVAIHEVGEDQGEPFIAMDLVEGPSLEERLERDGPMPVEEAAAVAEKVARALYYAHTHQIVHRDVKPANILLDGSGAPFLVDFGIAKLADATEQGVTRAGQMLGTPGFMSPEQAEGRLDRVDRRSDVYSLGATLYAMLTGRAPYEGTPLEILGDLASRDPGAPGLLRPGLDRDLETICLRCLEREPGQRYASAEALAEDLARFLRHEPIEARRPGLAERARKWARRHPAPAWTLAAALGAIVILVPTAVGWAAHTRRSAGLLAQAALVDAARGEADQALAALASVGSGPGQRDQSYQAVLAANRWQALTPDDATARAAYYRALTWQGRLAREEADWSLALRCFGIAATLGVDDERARAAVAEVLEARDGEARRRRAEIEELLARTRDGGVAARPGGLEDALFTLVRYPEPQTVALLSAELDGIAKALPAAAPPADLLRVVCRALGRIGLREVAVPALGSYLERETDPIRATEAGLALCRLGGPDAKRHLEAALARFGRRSHFNLRVNEADRGLLTREVVEGSAEAHRERTQERLDAGDLAGALEEVTRALELDPSAAASWSLRALVHCARKDWPEAVDAASRAIQLDPKLAPAHFHRAWAHQGQGRSDAALADLDRAIQLAPKRARYWLHRGLLHRDRDRGALERRDLLECARLDPEGLGFVARGILALEKKELASARRELERATALAPGDAAAWNLLGLVLHELGDARRALEAFDRAIELDPCATWFSDRSRTLLALGEGPRASADATRAIELDPQLALAWVNRASARLALGEKPGAATDLERFLELVERGKLRASHPAVAWARETLAGLRGR